LFVKMLSRFSVVLQEHHDLDAAAPAELTKSVTAVLGLGGSGVTMAEEGQLQFVTAVSPDSEELERSQEEHQEGPCRDAYETGEVVRVTDVRQESARWPDYSATATRLGLAGVAGIPMRDGGEVIGALNIYSREPREWSDQDIAVAVVLADVATSYVLNASKLHDPSPSDTKPSTDDGITLIRYRDGCVDGQGYHHLWTRRLVSTCTGAARPTFLWSTAYPHI
jgi:transcriptional regulator with GAF, ATPase, and Fis domain